MPSSISSSSDRLPRGKWVLSWSAALVIVALVAGSWETLLRVRGLGIASVDDTAQLWATERERAATLGTNAMILVGASRMQMDVDLATLRQYTTKTPVQLAISAAPFMPVLESLADDDRVVGDVIVSFTMNDFLMPTRDSVSEQWVSAYTRLRASRTLLLYQRLEDTLRGAVGSVLLSVGSGARPQQLLFGSKVSYVRTLPDRSRHADYAIVDREAAYRHRIDVYLDGQAPTFRTVPDLEARLNALEAMVRKIQDRGGRVVLVRFPTTKRIWEMDQILYPRAVYWDRIVARTSARTVHFSEHAALSAFDLPDGVHLDYRDAPAFTQALAPLILESLAPGPRHGAAEEAEPAPSSARSDIVGHEAP